MSNIELAHAPGLAGITALGPIPGCLNRKRRNVPGKLVLSVAVRRRPVELSDHDKRAVIPYHTHHLTKEPLLIPFSLCLVEGLRKSVIVRTREKLFGSVELSCLKQLFGAYHTEGFAKLLSKNVLSTIAPRQRKIGRTSVLTSGEVRKESGILVVRVRSDHQCAGRCVQALQHLRQTKSSLVVDRTDLCDGC